MLGPVPSATAQEVQRCTTMSGETVYTDKRCEDIGAMDHLPSPATEATATAGHLYQWAGVSDEGANRILNRLEAVVQRPLVDIAPIRPAPPPIVDDAGNVVDTNTDGYYPQTTQLPRPIGLRIVQTLKNSATPSQTDFSLRRNYGCFWITL